MGRRAPRLVRVVEGWGLEHNAQGSGTLGHSGVDENNRAVGVQFAPNRLEGRFAKVFAVVGGE